MTPIEKHTNLVKETAIRLGFDFCGISKAQKLDDDERRLADFLNKGYNGKLGYLENWFDKRVDPTKLVPGAKSVIALMKNYYPGQHQREDAPQVAKYAYGKDYHLVIHDRLNEFMDILHENIGEINARGFTDSAPVLEKSWASRSGLGWVGKNGLLLTRQAGSFFFLATIITDLELVYDNPFVKDYCGTCTRCIDACPTDAILPNKVINASSCISYFTIELKDEIIPDEMQGKFENKMFGCDICQDVCPWNRFAEPHHDDEFKPIWEILHYSEKDWVELTEEKFNDIFHDSPLKRAKYKGLKRNLKFLKDGPDTEGSGKREEK